MGVPRLISTIRAETGAELEWHGHNDFGFATANSVLAWRYGARRVNVAFGGLGERTGNTTLEQVTADYIRLYGDPGFRLSALREMSALIQDEIGGVNIKSPIIGDAIFSTQAGIHQAGVARQGKAEGGDIYLPFDPKLLGGDRVELHRVGSLSGAEGIVAILNAKHLEKTGEADKYTKATRVVKYIYDKIQEAYDGEWDEASASYRNARETFFNGDELYALALEYESLRAKRSEQAKTEAPASAAG